MYMCRHGGVGRSEDIFLQWVLSFTWELPGSAPLCFPSPHRMLGLWTQGIASGLLWVVDQTQVIRVIQQACLPSESLVSPGGCFEGSLHVLNMLFSTKRRHGKGLVGGAGGAGKKAHQAKVLAVQA